MSVSQLAIITVVERRNEMIVNIEFATRTRAVTASNYSLDRS